MGALGAFNPSFLSQGPQFQPESPFETYGKYLSLRAMMDQQKVRAIQLQTEQMQLQQAQQKQQDAAQLRSYLATNPDLTTPEGRQRLYGYAGGAAIAEAIGKADKEQADALSKQYDYKAKLAADYGNRLWTLRTETDPLKRHQIYQDASKWAVQHGVISPAEYAQRQQLQDAPMPQDLANEMNDNIGAVGIFKLKADEAAAQKTALLQPSEVAKSEAEAGKATTEANVAARNQSLDELAGITGEDYNVDSGAYAQWRANAPKDIQQSMPEQAVPGKIRDLLRSRVKQEQLPEYDIKTGQAQLMSQMKPGDWDAQVDAVIPPAGDTATLNRRTKAQVQTAVKMGMPFTAVQAVLKDASDQVGRTETAVRTAKSTAPIKIDVAAATTAARTPSISDNALDLAAQDYLNTGKLPSGAGRSPAMGARIMNRAGQMMAESGQTAQGTLLQRNAAIEANKAYQKVNTQYQTLKPFADMAEKNADVLEKAAAGIPDIWTSVLNTPIRDLASKFGSTKMAAFNAAILPVQADFARILNSPTGAGVLSDHARSEMHKAIAPGATVSQIKAALDIFRTDAKNRRESYEAEIKDLLSQTVAGGGQAPGAGPSGASQATHRYNPATGMIEAK